MRFQEASGIFINSSAKDTENWKKFFFLQSFFLGKQKNTKQASKQ